MKKIHIKFLAISALLIFMAGNNAIARESEEINSFFQKDDLTYIDYTSQITSETNKKEDFPEENTELPEEPFEKIENDIDQVEPIDMFKLKVSVDEDKNRGFLRKTWKFIKGRPSDNAIQCLMFSHHLSEKADEYNESNKLFGLDYKGYTIGTFNNSYHRQTYYAGITRELWDHNFNNKVKLDFKYKLIGMHGYQHKYPDLFGITPLIAPVFGLTVGHVGADFIVMPADRCTFSFNFRVNLPEFRKRKKAAK